MKCFSEDCTETPELVCCCDGEILICKTHFDAHITLAGFTHNVKALQNTPDQDLKKYYIANLKLKLQSLEKSASLLIDDVWSQIEKLENYLEGSLEKIAKDKKVINDLISEIISIEKIPKNAVNDIRAIFNLSKKAGKKKLNKYIEQKSGQYSSDIGLIKFSKDQSIELQLAEKNKLEVKELPENKNKIDDIIQSTKNPNETKEALNAKLNEQKKENQAKNKSTQKEKAQQSYKKKEIQDQSKLSIQQSQEEFNQAKNKSTLKEKAQKTYKKKEIQDQSKLSIQQSQEEFKANEKGNLIEPKYKRKEVQIDSQPHSFPLLNSQKEDSRKENEIYISSKGIKNSIEEALTLLNREDIREVILKGFNMASYNVVVAAETIKMRKGGLFQINELSTEVIENGEDAKEKSCISISICLSKDPLDSSHYGYQPPIFNDKALELDSSSQICSKPISSLEPLPSFYAKSDVQKYQNWKEYIENIEAGKTSNIL